MQPSVTVILDRLNPLDLLVACTRYCQNVSIGISNRLPCSKIGRSLSVNLCTAFQCPPRNYVSRRGLY
jgi:hypothetical protein